MCHRDRDPLVRHVECRRAATDVIRSGEWVTVLNVDRGQKYQVPKTEDARVTADFDRIVTYTAEHPSKSGVEEVM
jgi:hypothetical protein